MPFDPDFMSRPDEFERALALVRSVPDWLAFKARFFHDQPWPRRSAEALAAARGDGSPVVAGGRTFHRAPLPDDLSPDARYAYFRALGVGLAATYPPNAPPPSDAHVRWTCPACEVWTDAPGEAACPLCGRPLLAMRLPPPR
ncbi:hypothetical protein [Anaeromyxobacter oryzae]|uniref:Zinc ribbon domain-containing protein n=1 Tax=Anaeromyxobacter oryzae TaxID=2918170 RepID=A0ABN6MT92_9BACT|nr:hypothetical protein [Anaeromyxobacter oryzae]BDG03721.1 hypothetical protein AMOR_27170 [Anaeromyxobacter oryzae]